MENPSKGQIWATQFRAPFLLLAAVLVLIGLAYALKYPLASDFNFFHAFLLLIGVVSAHISVNLFNEYSDYKTKIDFDTKRTPFSGGTGMLIEGKTKPKDVKRAAYITLLLGLAIGIYFVFAAHWFLVVFILIGALTTLFYTPLLAKILLGEFFSGLALGSLVVLGVYIAMTASPGMPINDLLPKEVWLLSIPPGILTSLLLLLNEFPDVAADKKGGRFHLVIKFGHKGAAIIYAMGIVATYAIIVISAVAGVSSYWILLALATLPIAIKATTTALKFGSSYEKIIPALGQNVLVVLVTDLLIAVAVFVEILC